MAKYLDEIGVTAKTKQARLDTLQRTVEKTAVQIEQIQEAQRPRLTIANAWDAFERSKNRKQCREITLTDYRNRWAHFTRWAEGRHTIMEDVTSAVAEAFTSAMDDDGKLSDNRCNKVVQTARYVFSILADQCNHVGNPFGATSKAGISNRVQRRTSRRSLSGAEVMDVCQKATGELRTLFAIGVYTGLRMHNAACLQWDSLNLELRRLVVTPHKTANRNGKTLVIPMHPTLFAIFDEAPPTARRGDVLPDSASTYRRDPASLSKRIRKHFEACDVCQSPGVALQR